MTEDKKEFKCRYCKKVYLFECMLEIHQFYCSEACCLYCVYLKQKNHPETKFYPIAERKIRFYCEFEGHRNVIDFCERWKRVRNLTKAKKYIMGKTVC